MNVVLHCIRAAVPCAHRVSGRSHRFLAAAYLLVVIPGLLAVGGMDKGAATTGTILVFVAGTLLMAFYANLPLLSGPALVAQCWLGG